MANGIHRLADRDIAAIAPRDGKRGTVKADGGGLFLRLSRFETRSWEFRYRRDGQQRCMCLGPYPAVSPADARERAAELRKAVREGRDPLEERKAEKVRAEPVARPAAITFAEAVALRMADKGDEYKNEKHRAQWSSTLNTYAVPLIGSMNVADVGTQDVLRVLRQPLKKAAGRSLWEARTETATRLRGRIEAVLAWAGVHGYRDADLPNPARWEKHLEEALPKPSAVSEEENQPAISQEDVTAWFAALRTREGIAPRALEFLALCASRSGEIRGATWSEIDLKKRVWVVPAARMKMKRPHIVPLSDAAVALLEALPRIHGSDLVFPAPRGGMLSDMALSAVMRRMHDAAEKAGRAGWRDKHSGRPAVPHGLRSTFRTWASDHGHDRNLAEKALAHKLSNDVEARYDRSDMLMARQALMQDWSAFALPQG